MISSKIMANALSGLLLVVALHACKNDKTATTNGGTTATTPAATVPVNEDSLLLANSLVAYEYGFKTFVQPRFAAAKDVKGLFDGFSLDRNNNNFPQVKVSASAGQANIGMHQSSSAGGRYSVKFGGSDPGEKIYILAYLNECDGDACNGILAVAEAEIAMGADDFPTYTNGVLAVYEQKNGAWGDVTAAYIPAEFMDTKTKLAAFPNSTEFSIGYSAIQFKDKSGKDVVLARAKDGKFVAE